MIGSRHAGRRGVAADAVIIGEPTGLAVCPVHKGQVCWRVTVHGTAAHSSRPELGTNAIVHMTRVIDALQAYGTAIASRPAHPLCGTGSVNPGVISGGTIASTVPDRCVLEFDRRVLPGEDRAAVEAEIRQVLDDIATAHGIRYELSTPTLDCPALDTPLDAPVVQALLDAHAAVRGTRPTPTAFPAATDAPHLGGAAVICGPGDLALAHTVHESVAIDEVVDAAELYLHAVRTLLS
jgi:acetylornithine deacetylase